MATDIFILSSASESWDAMTEDLARYLASQANGRNVGFHEGNNLYLKSGEFFRSVGVPAHSLCIGPNFLDSPEATGLPEKLDDKWMTS